jgi:hypothetical protein
MKTVKLLTESGVVQRGILKEGRMTDGGGRFERQNEFRFSVS